MARRAMAEALSNWGNTMAVGNAQGRTDTWAQAGAAGFGAFGESLARQRKEALEAEERRKKAENEAFRQALEDRKADERERSAQAREDAATKRQADTDERERVRNEHWEAAQERQRQRDEAADAERGIDNKRADAQLALSQGTASRADASAARAESNDQRRWSEAEEKERRASVLRTAEKRYEAEMATWKESVRSRGINESPTPAPNWQQIYGEALARAGMPHSENGRNVGGSPTPRSSAPSGAPHPPAETSRTPPAPKNTRGTATGSAFHLDDEEHPAATPSAPATDVEPKGLRARAALAGFDVEKARRDGYSWAEIKAALGG